MKDITGKLYGRLSAVKYSHKDTSQHHFWFFQCECGELRKARLDNVIAGRTKNCKCGIKHNRHEKPGKVIPKPRFTNDVPMCSDKEQFAGWTVAKNKPHAPKATCGFCTDCTPAYQAEMLRQNRCENPHVSFKADHMLGVYGVLQNNLTTGGA